MGILGKWKFREKKIFGKIGIMEFWKKWEFLVRWEFWKNGNFSKKWNFEKMGILHRRIINVARFACNLVK